MAIEIKKTWVFTEKVLVKDIDLDINIDQFLVEGEEIVCAYKTVRDMAIFTNKRVVIQDTPGLTGNRVTTYTVPYKSINMFSVENAHVHDPSSEVELWTRNGNIKLQFVKDFDINLINKVIANEVLKG